MFTGITEHVARIKSIENGAHGGRLRVGLAGAAAIAAEMKLGDSIAVNGCCLTVAEVRCVSFFARTSPARRCAGPPSAKKNPETW